MVDYKRPDRVLIDGRNSIALVTHMAVPWTHILSSTETQKITKYENLALEIKNIRKLNYGAIHSLVISAEGVVISNFLKYLENAGLIENVLGVGQRPVLLQMFHILRKFLEHAL
jgi:hypothetical protein